MKTRWKILIAVGTFLVLLTGSMIFSTHFQPENAVEACKKALRERGEKLEISEVVPPPAAPESNSVNAVEDAFQMFVPGLENIPNAMTMVAPGRAMVGWEQPDARDYDFTNSWEDFAAGVAADQPAIELLHQVLERPSLDFQLDYTKGPMLLLPHLAPMKHAARKLDAAAVCELHFGDTGAAATNILTLLGLVQRNASEGLLISHLVRIAMTALAVLPTWELLQTTNIADAQLASVQHGWEQLDFLDDAENAFEMERAWGIDTIQTLRVKPDAFGGVLGMSASMSSPGSSSGGWFSATGLEAFTKRSRLMVAEVMWRSSWSYSDELHLLKSETILLQTLRTMRTNQSQFYKADYDGMEKQLSSLGISHAGGAFFHALKIPDLGDVFSSWSLNSAVEKTLRMETARRIVVTAVALKRFQLGHGKLPETLDALTPDILAVVPIDPYSGKSLRYRLNADGSFTLYSVGEDGVDDSGDASVVPHASTLSFYWQNPKALDWVWPQPATEAEVQAYYQKQSKNSD